MDLKTYISLKRGRGSLLAKALNVSPVTVNEWVHGKKRVPAEKAPQIDQFTAGEVPVEVLRPDLAEQWEYLRTSRNLLPADGAQNPKERAA